MKNVDKELRKAESELIDRIMEAYRLEARNIGSAVELYYDSQGLRITNANRERTEGAPPPEELPKDYEPLTQWFHSRLQLVEKVIAGKLMEWVESDRSPFVAKWGYEQVGIGPVLAAGLSAHIDLEKAESPSGLWKFAGFAPGFDRLIKGQKAPYNTRLKVIAWKLGESFVKVSGKEGALYGHLYADFKAEEVRRNEAGLYKKQAARELATKDIKKEEVKAKLKAGFLTDGHLHARAKRRAVKIFLTHYWLRGREALGLPLRQPYVTELPHHSDIIPPPLPEPDTSKAAVDRERAIAAEQANARKRVKKKPKASEGE